MLPSTSSCLFLNFSLFSTYLLKGWCLYVTLGLQREEHWPVPELTAKAGRLWSSEEDGFWLPSHQQPRTQTMNDIYSLLKSSLYFVCYTRGGYTLLLEFQSRLNLVNFFRGAEPPYKPPGSIVGAGRLSDVFVMHTSIFLDMEQSNGDFKRKRTGRTRCRVVERHRHEQHSKVKLEDWCVECVRGTGRGRVGGGGISPLNGEKSQKKWG